MRLIMAAHVSAAALRSSSWYLFLCFWLLLLIDLFQSTQYYSRQELLNVGVTCSRAITSFFQQTHNIPITIAGAPGSLWITIPEKRRRRRRERKQKGGCRVGIWARLRKDQTTDPQPLSLKLQVHHPQDR